MHRVYRNLRIERGFKGYMIRRTPILSRVVWGEKQVEIAFEVASAVEEPNVAY